jgi:hypothetical protein
VAAFTLGLKEIQGFRLGDPTAALWVVLQGEIHKWLADDHAYLGRLAGIATDMAASTFIYGYFRRALEYQITSHRIRNNLLQVLQGDFFVQSNNCPSMFLREHLSVVVVGKSLPLFRPQARNDMLIENFNILIGPAPVYISMQTTKGPKATLTHHLPGRGTQKPPAFPEEPKK